MIALIALAAILSVSNGQFPYQQPQQQGYYQPQPYNSQSQAYNTQPQAYNSQPQTYNPPPQAYPPQPQQAYNPSQQQPQTYNPHQQQPQTYNPPTPAKSHNPAVVHYVNIGAQLAGDYKFGYDTGKDSNAGQSFREETRLPDGTVQGAYGYVDETGKQRIVKYTAGKDGFQVEGDGIPKAPAVPAAPTPAHGQQQANHQYYQGNNY